MIKQYFGLDLDECFDELWQELEKVQDGRGGHTIAIENKDKAAAANVLAARLVEFFKAKMYPSDEYGRRLE